MPAHKRTRTGQVKTNPPPPATSDPDIVMTDITPPCAQQPPPSTQSTETLLPPSTTFPLPTNPASPIIAPPESHSVKKFAQGRQKMAKLPPNTQISKRPLLHPALPTPFASAASPKVIYLTASSPYIPCLKRVRRLLDEIDRRAKQAAAAKSHDLRGDARGGGRRRGRAGHAEANGKLHAGAVERDIAHGVHTAGAGVVAEQVYVKATGRAIVRALEVGVFFQGEQGYRVRVEMGRVKAVDDIEVTDPGAKLTDEVPETRIRTLSSVTVGIARV